MPTSLFLSTHPGDALLGAGALMASLPPQRTFHTSVYAAPSMTTVDRRGTADLAQESEALGTLGVQHIEGTIVAPPNDIGDTELQTKLSALLSAHQPNYALLPLGLGQRNGDLQLHAICLRLRQLYPEVRWLQYYDQPFVGLNRGRFPELAFARRVQGLAEVDDEASLFIWKEGVANGGLSPLSRKLDASVALRSDLDQRLFRDREFDTPTSDAERREMLTRVLGAREWVSLM